MRPTAEKFYPFTPDSAEPLWYWHVPTDVLLLSAGATEALGLPDNRQITSMSQFLTHIPPSWLPVLNETRETALSGQTGSRAEVMFFFDNHEVQELLLVLNRDSQGRATHVMGHYRVHAENDTLQNEKGSEICSVGLWQCSRAERIIRLDRHCAALLGLAGEDGNVSAITLTHDAFDACLHQEDAALLERDYDTLTRTPERGDTLEHNIRVRRQDGSYALMKFCGAILERDPALGIGIYGGTLTDLSAAPAVLVRADLAQQDTRRLLYTVNSTGTGDGLWDWDATTNHVYFSPRYLSMLGYTAEEFPGHLDIWAKRIHPDDHDKIIYPQRAIVESPRYGDTFECTYRLLRKDGTWGWILGRGYVTHRDETGRATRLVGMHTDITGVQNEREKLEEMVKNDTLTGLRSRAYCNLEMERIEKNNIRPVSAIVADITGLKLVNDFMGHATGDRLLSTAAILLREPMRATDCVGRSGGDEFIILLPGCPEATCTILLDRLKACVEKHNAQTQDVPVFAAFGMATAPDTDTPLATILRRADAAMMKDKRLHRTQAQAHIKQWIESRTGSKVEFEDCRLIG